MPEKIAWSMSARVDGGPQISINEILEVEAYEKVNVILPGQKKTTIEVQQSEGLARLILIAPDKYEKLHFSVDGGSPIALDHPIMLVGEGAVNLLGKKQNVLEFNNENPDNVSVMMLVAGKAIK
jgi:hypothetical protein